MDCRPDGLGEGGRSAYGAKRREDSLPEADGLLANGVEVEIDGDDLIVHGRGGGRGGAPGGGTVATHMDHRIAMAFLVLGLASEKPAAVDDTGFIATSFPGYVPMMRSLGAEFA